MFVLHKGLLPLICCRFAAGAEESLVHSCCVCHEDYGDIARQSSTFGILLCQDGHDMCKDCWHKLSHKRCPECRVSMHRPTPVRVLEQEIRSRPVTCKWAGCRCDGLTVETISKHEEECLHKIDKCICLEFEGDKSGLELHQKMCLKHHMQPVLARVAVLEVEMSRLKQEMQSLRLPGPRAPIVFPHARQGFSLQSFRQGHRNS